MYIFWNVTAVRWRVEQTIKSKRWIKILGIFGVFIVLCFLMYFNGVTCHGLPGSSYFVISAEAIVATHPSGSVIAVTPAYTTSIKYAGTYIGNEVGKRQTYVKREMNAKYFISNFDVH